MIFFGTSGPQGPQGAGGAGPQGPQGVQGAQGAQGTQGNAGTQGPQGNQGVQGSQGVTGAQGPQGTVGSQGAQGATGPQGTQGSTGAQGAQGNTGAQGPQGFTGVQGATGAQGPQGTQGTAGAQGAQGTQGAQGAQGAQGPQGSGTVTAVTATAPLTSSGGTTPDIALGGVVPILNGGTGQTTRVAAFDALSPSTAAGDLIAYNGTHNVRLPSGSNGQLLRSNSGAGSGDGIEWADGSKAVRILNNAAGPIANFTASYTPTAAFKRLLIHVGVTGFTTNVGGQAITINLQVDGVTVGSQSVFAGNNLLHFCFPAFSVPVAALSVAAHTIALTAGSGYNSDNNDFATITVEELA